MIIISNHSAAPLLYTFGTGIFGCVLLGVLLTLPGTRIGPVTLTLPVVLFCHFFVLFSSKNDKERDQGWLSEFHTVYGINDEELIEELVQNKNYILFHKRYTAGYTWFFQKVYKIFKFRTSFLLLVSNEELKNISTEFEI